MLRRVREEVRGRVSRFIKREYKLHIVEWKVDVKFAESPLSDGAVGKKG